MTDHSIIVASAIVVAAACAAELNLLRIFIRDWRSGSRAGSLRPARARATRSIPKRHQSLANGRAAFRNCSAAVALALSSGIAAAEPPPASDAPQAPAENAEAAATAAAGSAVSLQLNFDYTTGYFYRGIVQEDSGLILQPAARLTINVLQEGDFKLDLIAGTWNSFHGQKTAAQTRSDFTEYWYESDLYAGLVVTKGKLSLTSTYTFLTSPSDAYETVQELGFTLALDDSEWLGAFALKPYTSLVFETGADASDGADSDTGTYLELGIGPGFSFECGKTPVTVTFPVSVGLSLEDYYQDSSGNDDAFGFAQAGVKFSLPLPVNNRYGAWTLNAGVAALFLGDHTQDLNDGDDTEIIGTIGLQWNF